MKTQQDLLWEDIVAIRQAIASNPSVVAGLGDTTDLNKHTRLHVTLDLFMRLVGHAIGVHVLLREEVQDPLYVVQRAVLEHLVSLAYLNQHEDPEGEALVYLAFSHLKRVKVFANQDCVVSNRAEILERMPPVAVATAKRRLKNKPHTWSGLTIRAAAKRVGLEGHDRLFDFLSGEAHAATIGERVRIIRDEEAGVANIRMGGWLPDRDVQAQANFTRRFLKQALRIVWAVADGPPIQLPTPDPDTWAIE